MCFFSFFSSFWQHHYKAGAGLGEGSTPAERDLCGLCTFSVSHPAGQPRAGAADRRWVAVSRFVDSCTRQHATVCEPPSAWLMDVCGSRRRWQESRYFAHKLGVCHWLIKSALPFIHLTMCGLFSSMSHSTYRGLFRDVVFLNISVSQTQQMSRWNGCWSNWWPLVSPVIFLTLKTEITSRPVAPCLKGFFFGPFFGETSEPTCGKWFLSDVLLL